MFPGPTSFVERMGADSLQVARWRGSRSAVLPVCAELIDSGSCLEIPTCSAPDR